MNIYGFESYINKTIFERGYDYFLDGRVVEAGAPEDDTYFFLVRGSENYEVIVNVDDEGEILHSECDCPYDFGNTCKHEVAAYIKLSEILKSARNNLSIEKEPQIDEVLNQLSKDELIKIILDVTEKNSIFEKSLIVKYSKGSHEQEIETSKQLIEAIVRKYLGRDEFISYRDTFQFVTEMEDVLDKARATDEPELAVEIAFLLLDEAMGVFQYADDSDGHIGQLVDETIECLREIVEEIIESELELRKKIFQMLLKKTDSDIFDGWDNFRIEFVGVCLDFSDDEEMKNRLIMKIKGMVSENSDDEYRNESLTNLLYEITDKYGPEEDAEKILMDHLGYSSFRDRLLDRLMREKNYQEVIRVAKEGEQEEGQYGGLVSRWKNIRYRAYKELSLKEEQEKLARELLFNGDFVYYIELKKLVDDDDEAVFYEALKQELKKGEGWQHRNMYLELIKYEKDLDELLDLVRKNPRMIEWYGEMLREKFEDDVIEIYEIHIMEAARKSSNRNAYRKVCGIISKYKNMAGNKRKDKLVEQLLHTYKKRPAFVDELNKL